MRIGLLSPRRPFIRTISSLALALACFATTMCGDSPAAPTAADMTGTWSGMGTYPNSPFQLVLTQTGTALKGEYSDKLDRSTSVTGTYMEPTFLISVNFGDAGLTITGTLAAARSAQGAMFTPSLGNQMFSFTMTR
jgi:hypothetical protein